MEYPIAGGPLTTAARTFALKEVPSMSLSILELTLLPVFNPVERVTVHVADRQKGDVSHAAGWISCETVNEVSNNLKYWNQFLFGMLTSRTSCGPFINIIQTNY